MTPEAVMVFAAGLGTRMGALTRDRPKPLIEVAGAPLIDHALALVRDAGVRRIVVNTHAHPGQMHAHLARVAPEALISHEPVLLETGGGLRQALPLLGPGPVFTLNADMVWRGPNPLAALAAAWREADGALLCLVPRAGARGHGGPGDFFVDDGGRLRRRGAAEAADFVYTGAQIIDPAALAGFPDGGVLAQRGLGCAAGRGAPARHRPSGRLGRRRPARGDRARRGGARAVTRLFAPVEGPRVFGLAPGVDFSRALVAGLEARLAGQPPEAMARVEVWVNTRRAARALTALLASGPARLLPRIRVVTELAADPLGPLDLGAPVSELRRRLDLARLVGALADAEPQLASGTAVFDLADSLGRAPRGARGRGDRAGGVRRGRGGRARGALAAQPALPRAARGVPGGGRAGLRAGADAGRGGGAGRGLGARAAGAPGDRRGLDRLARGDAGVHGGGGAAAAGGGGAARARRGPAASGLAAARGGRSRGRRPSAARLPRPRRRARLRSDGGARLASGATAGARAQCARLAGAAAGAGDRPVAERGRGARRLARGRLRRLAWVEAPDPRGEALAIALAAARGGRDRGAGGAGDARPRRWRAG